MLGPTLFFDDFHVYRRSHYSLGDLQIIDQTLQIFLLNNTPRFTVDNDFDFHIPYSSFNAELTTKNLREPGDIEIESILTDIQALSSRM